MTEMITCPECGHQMPRGAVNHIYCSRECAKKEQRRRRTLRRRGVTAETIQSVAQHAPQLSLAAQQELDYWVAQSHAAQINGMTLEQWIAEGRTKSGNDVITEIYGTAGKRPKPILLEHKPATPTEDKKHEEGKD